MSIADQKSRLPWWHRRVVCVSDDEAWAALAAETIRELGGWPETLTWSAAETLEGPLGALVVNADVASADEDTLVRWAAAARQPTALLWVPPSRRAARIGHTLDRLRYRHVFQRASTARLEKELKRHLPRILGRGGWIVPWYAEALGWCAEPFLVHVLSLPVLSERPPENVDAWRRAVGKLSPAEFVRLLREARRGAFSRLSRSTAVRCSPGGHGRGVGALGRHDDGGGEERVLRQPEPRLPGRL